MYRLDNIVYGDEFKTIFTIKTCFGYNTALAIAKTVVFLKLHIKRAKKWGENLKF